MIPLHLSGAVIACIFALMACVAAVLVWAACVIVDEWREAARLAHNDALDDCRASIEQTCLGLKVKP